MTAEDAAHPFPKLFDREQRKFFGVALHFGLLKQSMAAALQAFNMPASKMFGGVFKTDG